MRVRLPSNSNEALQRLADSLQVLVLLLPVNDDPIDPRTLLLAAAARQTLEDIAHLQRCLTRSSQES